MVLAHADVRAGVPFGAALTNDDVAGENALIAELLDAETTAGGIAPVARRTACFLVGHDELRDFALAGFAEEGTPKIATRRPARRSRPSSCAARAASSPPRSPEPP